MNAETLNLECPGCGRPVALGQKECAAAAVTDAGLARAFLEKLGLSGSKADGKKRESPDISAAGGKSKGGNC